MIALALTLVLAAPKVSIGPPPPLIVMIRTDGPSAFIKTQSRLHEELTLLLDSFIVLNTPISVPDFPRKPLADQLAAVLPVAKANDAAAVVWLSEPIPGQLMLHLVAQGTGRTLVRTLEFDKKSRNESALALMMRELLGTAFLYEAPATVPPQLRAVIKQTRATMSGAAEVAPMMVETPIAPPAPPGAPAPEASSTDGDGSRRLGGCRPCRRLHPIRRLAHCDVEVQPSRRWPRLGRHRPPRRA